MKCPSCSAENDEPAEVCFTCGKPIAVLTRGARLGERYEILEILGKGGMGIVYKAHDSILDEDVALKVLRRDVAATGGMASRFRGEIKLARRVSHPNVCLIHDYGESAGLGYISMEWLEGQDLEQLLKEHPTGLPADEAFGISIQMAEGLQAIHEAGIIHRDLKAPNVMRDPEGRVRLMDFGLAKETEPGADHRLTVTGAVLGTPSYMSPEQCLGEKLTFRSDIYSLGVLVFELFTGVVPFRGETPIATLLKHIQEPFSLEGPAVERLPKSLRAILTKALKKQPEARFQTAGSVAEALRQARIGTLRPAVRPSKTPPAVVSPEAAPRPQQKERRSETRLKTPVNVVLRRLDESGQALQEERTIVDNISRKGARVMTSMSQIPVGALVELEEVGGDFRVRATVRASHTGSDHIPRLSLRFENGSAPDRLVQTDDAREATHTTRIPIVSNSSVAPAARPGSRQPAAAETGRTRAARAERTLALARKLVREKKYSDAIQTIEPAIRETGSPVTRRRLQILLAQATAKNPKWRKRAEAVLQEVLADDPSNVEARYELAKLYQANGLESQAQREFRRVLELDPAHKGAAAAQTEGR